MTTIRWITLTLLLALPGGAALADGMIVPVRPDIRVSGNWAIKYHHVKVDVENQVAKVSVDQEFVNLSGGMLEVEYIFPVPPDAAIDAMTLSVNGKDFSAKLLKADEARAIYENIVRSKKDPALLEYVGYGMVKTRAFPLEPGKPARVTVNYKTVCKKNFDMVQVLYPLNTEKFSAKNLEEVQVTVNIASKADITTVYSPTHDVAIKHTDPKHLTATYQAKDVLPADDFLLFYKESNDAVGANLMTHQPQAGKDGYFLMLVSPSPRQVSGGALAKDLVVVLDHSGSMGDDRKMDQAKDALKYVLKNLNKEDRFNVVAFSDSAEAYFDKLQDATEKNVTEALDRTAHLDATGSTDIYGAMQEAVRQVAAAQPATQPDNKEQAARRPAYIIFLTDGRPTAGKSTEESDILKDTAAANKDVGARIFAFGVGYDVNVRLLDKMVGDNGGRSDYVKPKEDIEGKVSTFYAKIRNPVMTNVKVEIAGVRLRDNYPKDLGDLFEGDEIVVAGRYFGEDVPKLEKGADGLYHTNLTVKGVYAGKDKTFTYPVTFNPGGKNWRYDFVKKLWAIRRVGFLLDQVQLNGSSQEIIDELVRLSRDYGIMTPYTSFLADETVALNSEINLRKHASGRLKELETVEGATGQRGAMNRQELSNAKMATPNSVSANAGSGKGSGAAQLGHSGKDTYEQNQQERVVNVQNIGNQTLYRRGKVWVTPQTAKLDLEKDAAKIKVVKQFSDEYFKLVRANTVAQNQLMSSQAAGEELVVELRGQVYRIKA